MSIDIQVHAIDIYLYITYKLLIIIDFIELYKFEIVTFILNIFHI